MEADMVVEVFNQSEAMHGVRYGKFIGDGDSSVFSKIQQLVKHGKQVRKVECTNHALKNHGKRLRSIKSDTQINLKGRKLLTIARIKLLTKRAKCSIYEHAKKTVPNVDLLRHDFKNGLHHVLGDHSNCREGIYNLDKAKEKLKQAEFTSDVQSDSELDSQTIKRRRIAPRKLYESESEESETNEEFLDLPRPPQIKSKTSQLSQKSSVEKNRVGTPSVDSKRDSMTSTPIVQKSDTNQISGYQQILRTLEYIKEQNKQILALLNSRGGSFSNQASYNLDNLPVEIPLSSNEDLNILENFLKEDQNLRNLMSYLSSLGGKDHIVQTNNCLRRLLTNDFSCQFSFMGKRGGKKAFSDLLLKKCVIGAVTKNLPQIKERDIEDAIKNWLKHSPQRYHNELLKNRRNTN
ncbi:unnamed protein product [Phaedon cochleariae]|uniref:DUF4806 domain-containing protein n=1 Tax=Phaedon cochleariae TaxID=80249 RepID=A0A9N9SGK7_PHACE|nr:unnamed protein product [Phaedon cochleariae]